LLQSLVDSSSTS